MTNEPVTAFNQLALSNDILTALQDVGYETPSPIQAQTIPLLLEGRDVLGQAQTGTGKTAAFALPLLSNIDINQKDPQVLVLTPTRELAIQVAEAFQKYASHIDGFHVVPIYGGADYTGQIRALKRGVHVVVGTPGRVMDHMRKRTLKLNNLKTMVLDEADEMLRMGFIEDVEWILEQTPDDRQIALFSATMPSQVRRIATNYQNNPAEITIKAVTATADNIRQRFWPVSGVHKLDALTRILEAETYDGIIIFCRTKNITTELAEKMAARGYACDALNGDVKQSQREKIIERLKNGKLDIIVATDVAARGIDVARVTHVINYDIPHDTEAYVHRIGRTGRAGRSGDAILFVAPREKRMLNAIERATKNKIERMELPTTEVINDKRVIDFKQRITDTISHEDLSIFTSMIGKYMQENPDVPAEEIAAAMAHLLQGKNAFLLEDKPMRRTDNSWDSGGRNERKSRKERDRDRSSKRDGRGERKERPRRSSSDDAVEPGMQRYRIEVGHSHDVRPGNIVGAIANEADISSEFIGRIAINDDFSTVDLPSEMSRDLIKGLRKTWVSGQQLNITPYEKDTYAKEPREDRSERSEGKKKNRDKPRYKSKADRGDSEGRGGSDSRHGSNDRSRSEGRGNSEYRGKSENRGGSDSRGNSEFRGSPERKGGPDKRHTSGGRGKSAFGGRSENGGADARPKRSSGNR